jgi:hypothetical protein
MDKRYQVFTSSTFADLKEERQAVIEMNCIPAGMELFPAADENQLDFIKRVIDDCDYYLLIIGGRYGSTTPDGISYTEKEYEYAVSRELKVIALVHENPDEIPFGKSEQNPQRRESLQRFRDKVCTNRLVKFWTSAHDLPGLVALSLANTMHTYPAVGWVRANTVASADLLGEINDLRKQNSQLLGAVAELRSEPALENLAGLQESIELHGTCRDKSSPWSKTGWRVKLTWNGIFAIVSPYLAQVPTDQYVKWILTSAAFKCSNTFNADDASLDDQEFRTVALQLEALGLVKLQYSETTTGSMGLFWLITSSGKRLMLELRTVKSASATEAKDATAKP